MTDPSLSKELIERVFFIPKSCGWHHTGKICRDGADQVFKPFIFFKEVLGREDMEERFEPELISADLATEIDHLVLATQG